MLAPLLLGTGMLLRSIKSHASYAIPRLGLMVVLLWLIWFLNSVIQNTWAILRKTGRLDARMAAGLYTFTECASLMLAGIVILSMLGINISGLLLPAGICVAIASKDLLQNLLAGFFLFVVQPFRIGDTVAVTTSAGMPRAQASSGPTDVLHGFLGGGSGSGPGGSTWFEGICEKVDLRYTVLRQGKRRLMVPNTAFVNREFMVVDEAVVPGASGGAGSWGYGAQQQDAATQTEQPGVPGPGWDAGNLPGAPMFGLTGPRPGYGLEYGQAVGQPMWQPAYMYNGFPATPIVPGSDQGWGGMYQGSYGSSPVGSMQEEQQLQGQWQQGQWQQQQQQQQQSQQQQGQQPDGAKAKHGDQDEGPGSGDGPSTGDGPSNGTGSGGLNGNSGSAGASSSNQAQQVQAQHVSAPKDNGNAAGQTQTGSLANGHSSHRNGSTAGSGMPMPGYHPQAPAGQQQQRQQQDLTWIAQHGGVVPAPYMHFYHHHHHQQQQQQPWPQYRSAPPQRPAPQPPHS
jgi:hypothetical protein